ncbi:hypothetical protein AWJ20_1340 [Sugiyamaella lignohabitans]|uniref:Uncharacterized protein n=1 Tax=Sugiyamaella lignohabitans TaxID=796027 RepID=A0A167DM67_9ASCO|nr:uncharacterized protein AWJ20_1340 [Sugiyamaella lignohabitans]ANB13062.1 hypothetical protein AWJ20_1340 [Sugiyamaella lignohabitans]
MSAVRVITEQLSSSFGDPVYCHLTVPAEGASEKAQITLYVSGSQAGPGQLGSLVYALPAYGLDNKQTIRMSRLFQSESSIENAERLAQALVKKFGRPALVGSSLGSSDGTGDAFTILKFVGQNIERVA